MVGTCYLAGHIIASVMFSPEAVTSGCCISRLSHQQTVTVQCLIPLVSEGLQTSDVPALFPFFLELNYSEKKLALSTVSFLMVPFM